MMLDNAKLPVDYLQYIRQESQRFERLPTRTVSQGILVGVSV